MTALQGLAAIVGCFMVAGGISYGLQLLVGPHPDKAIRSIDYRERNLANGDGQ